MRCPFCEHTESRVLESRSTESGQSVRRRRQCLHCQRRFTTYERIEFVPMIAIKRDGKRESFDRSKLLRGIVRACEKTAIAPERLEAIVDDIELRLHQRTKREIHTSEIGEIVLDSLKDLSEVAYVRFASVYQQFQGVRDFVEALDRLRESRPDDSLDDPRDEPQDLSPETAPNCAIST